MYGISKRQELSYIWGFPDTKPNLIIYCKLQDAELLAWYYNKTSEVAMTDVHRVTSTFGHRTMGGGDCSKGHTNNPYYIHGRMGSQ